jgi:hypothetical protein
MRFRFSLFFLFYIPIVLIAPDVVFRSANSPLLWWPNYLFGELLLLGAPIAAALWLSGRKDAVNADQAYTRGVLFLTGLILAPIFCFVVVPLGFKSFEGATTAFSVAVAAFLISAYAYYAWLWLRRRRNPNVLPRQMVISRQVMAVMRKAVSYAFAAESEFVEPSHLRLALLDDETTAGRFELDYLLAAVSPEGSLNHSRDPQSEGECFPIYRSLYILTPDGKRGKWLDRNSYAVFLEGARRPLAGAYLPKHLAEAYHSFR